MCIQKTDVTTALNQAGQVNRNNGNCRYFMDTVATVMLTNNLFSVPSRMMIGKM